MKTLKVAVCVLLLMLSSSAWSFMPANGLWGIDIENTGQPGRGFNIEVENEILVFTYYGYRADGSSNFYIAAGPVVNNVFSASLLEFRGGTWLGGPYNPAVQNWSAGNVTLSFTSGEHGTITLPGESPKAISKSSFGYYDGPDGLLGQWQLSMFYGTQGPGATMLGDVKFLSTKTGLSTTTGNGIVINSAGDFFCEFQSSGVLAGAVTCAEGPIVITGTNAYIFKFSGDRGDGIGMFYTSPTTLSAPYEAHALRTSTKTGTKTGLNDGTVTSISILSAKSTSATTLPMADTLEAKELAASFSIGVPATDEDVAGAAALAAWAEEVRFLIYYN